MFLMIQLICLFLSFDCVRLKSSGVDFLWAVPWQALLFSFCHSRAITCLIACRRRSHLFHSVIIAQADLFNVTTEDGKRSIVVIETNTCPSGPPCV